MRSMMFHKQAELILVILIIAILAVLQLKSFMPVHAKAKILHSAGAAFQCARMDNVFYHAYHGEWPEDNEQALRFGMNNPYLFRDGSFKDLQLKDGAVTLTFNKFYPDKTITFRPAVPADDPFGPMIWVVGKSRPAEEWMVFGEDLTNIEDSYIQPYIK